MKYLRFLTYLEQVATTALITMPDNALPVAYQTAAISAELLIIQQIF